jgi:hypothetical protein
MEFCGGRCAAGLGVNLNEIRSRFPDYPAEILEMQERAARVAHRLSEDFGRLVVAKPVGFASPRGLWLSFRHRLRNELSVVVNGRRVLRGSTAYEALRKVIDEESGVSPIEARVGQAKVGEEPKEASSGCGPSNCG